MHKNKKTKHTRSLKKVYMSLIALGLVITIIVAWFFVFQKTRIVQDNLNSHINSELYPLDFGTNKEVKRNLGIVSKNKVSCSSSLVGIATVKTSCILKKGSLSILNFQGKEKVQIPIVEFEHIKAEVETPLTTNSIYRDFNIVFSIDGINTNELLLDRTITKNSDSIRQIAVGDEEEIADYYKSKKELYSVLKDFNFIVSVDGFQRNSSNMDMKYEIILKKDKVFDYRNKATFSIVKTRRQAVLVELDEKNSEKYDNLNKGSFKQPGYEFVLYGDKSVFTFKDSELIKNLIYDFYKINYYGSYNKGLHNLYYLGDKNDILFSKEEVIENVEEYMNLLYSRVKATPYGVLVRGLKSIYNDKSGIYSLKQLKFGKKPISVLTESTKLNLNYNKYYKKLTDTYKLKEVECSDINSCVKLYKGDK